ncbi:gfo/Idh/MocA family oxidoreductase [Rhodobacteraceae bacterium 2CG4]|uniref:Gfo/Idh/MocA family oxidoreductase n=1 Tax=Halovulum marinum TaxID=2662447 RepID=A0A6L5YYN7_9RHOB|nr:Gfo/Idh/MocA family oxidoreductase [Halovulum marinum]MSU89318.1 gfo/Idh/MocA family oxidoreductase [Halovulum marinum]
MSKLKVGVVGSGIGASHIEGFQALPECYEVAAICDIEPERRGKVAARYGIAAQVDRLEALFDLDLDIIDICTPSGMHFAQATQVLEAGFDVVIEKPVARSLAEVDALIEVEARSGRRACPVFQYRFGHGIQKLHHLIAKGVAGRPSVATAETHWYRGPAYYQAGPWRGTWEGETGGCFTTHAIHIHDLICEVLGPPVSVHARASNRLNGNETEDMGLLSLEFESGALASSSVTLGSRHEMSRLRFCFDGLVAESGLSPYNPGHEPWTFPNDDAARAAAVEEALGDFAPLPERFPGQFLRMHTAMTEGTALPVTLQDARRSIELLTAAYWSARTGEAVRLPLGPEHPFYAGWLETMKEDTAHG